MCVPHFLPPCEFREFSKEQISPLYFELRIVASMFHVQIPEMHSRFLPSLFLLVGLVIGVILTLQIRAKPVSPDYSPSRQIENQTALLTTFREEHDDLQKRLGVLRDKRKDAQFIIDRRSSSESRQRIEHLKEKASLASVDGGGIRITLSDNLSVTRIDFSSFDENYVQSSHVRDLVNLLFHKNAEAISVNGRRITPLTSIQSLFDTILVGNFRALPPFVIKAIGNPDELLEGVSIFRKGKRIGVFSDTDVTTEIPPLESDRMTKYLFLSAP